MLTEVKVSRCGDAVLLLGPEGGKLARLEPEEAFKMAHNLLDHAEKALRSTDAQEAE